MWNRAKTVLMTIILVAVSLTVCFSLYLKAYTPVSKQWNPASFRYERIGTARNGIGSVGVFSSVPVSSPLLFEMSDASTIFEYRFGINLTSSTTVQFKFLATAPVNFHVLLQHGSRGWDVGIIISGITTNSLESEFYEKDSGFYTFVFTPVQSNPDATVIFDAQLDC
jgi:hypothetical protein